MKLLMFDNDGRDENKTSEKQSFRRETRSLKRRQAELIGDDKDEKLDSAGA